MNPELLAKVLALLAENKEEEEDTNEGYISQKDLYFPRIPNIRDFYIPQIPRSYYVPDAKFFRSLLRVK